MTRIRVIKLGGSLFSFPELSPCLRRWLDAQTHATNILIAGGGRLADEIRLAQARFALSDSDCHRLCLAVMNVTACLAYDILRPSIECKIWHRWDAADLIVNTMEQPVLHIVCMSEFALDEVRKQRFSAVLPADWSITSDSIAAALAIELSAEELVLLKSAAPREGATLAELAEYGYVDRAFPNLATRVPSVRMIDLSSLG